MGDRATKKKERQEDNCRILQEDELSHSYNFMFSTAF